jgi:hypothetical protein
MKMKKTVGTALVAGALSAAALGFGAGSAQADPMGPNFPNGSADLNLSPGHLGQLLGIPPGQLGRLLGIPPGQWDKNWDWDRNWNWH